MTEVIESKIFNTKSSELNIKQIELNKKYNKNELIQLFIKACIEGCFEFIKNFYKINPIAIDMDYGIFSCSNIIEIGFGAALYAENLHIAKWLCDMGVDPFNAYVSDNDRYKITETLELNAFILCCEFNKLKSVEFILSYIVNEKINDISDEFIINLIFKGIEIACNKANDDVIKVIINNINLPIISLNKILLHLIINSKFQLSKWLIDYGASISDVIYELLEYNGSNKYYILDFTMSIDNYPIKNMILNTKRVNLSLKKVLMLYGYKTYLYKKHRNDILEILDKYMIDDLSLNIIKYFTI
jgi:hypothetical protein